MVSKSVLVLFILGTLAHGRPTPTGCDWMDILVNTLFRKGPMEVEQAYRNFFVRYDISHDSLPVDYELAYNALMKLPDPLPGSPQHKKLKRYLRDLEKLIELRLEHEHFAISLQNAVDARLALIGDNDHLIGALALGEPVYNAVGPSIPIWDKENESVWRYRIIKHITKLGNSIGKPFAKKSEFDFIESAIGAMAVGKGTTNETVMASEILKNWGSDPNSPLFDESVKVSIQSAAKVSAKSGLMVPVATIELFHNYLNPKIVPPSKRNPIYQRQIQEYLANRTAKPNDPMFEDPDKE